MNTLVIVLIAAVCLIAAYTLYGRWLAKKWGIDPKAKTPAVVHNDGQDYVPTDGWTVPSRAQALSPEQSRRRHSAGCRSFCGSFWEASSSER